MRVFEWSSEQATEISAAAIDLEFLLMELALQWLHRALMTLTSFEANDFVANFAEEPVGGMAETAETIRSEDRWKETKLVEKDRFSWNVLSSGTSREGRTLGILRVAV